jgi:hypothetical protein
MTGQRVENLREASDHFAGKDIPFGLRAPMSQSDVETVVAIRKPFQKQHFDFKYPILVM